MFTNLKETCLGIKLGFVFLAATSFLITYVECIEIIDGFNGQSTQVLALELESTFIFQIENQEVTAYSNRISELFQGLNASGFITSKDDYLLHLTSLNIVSFSISNLYATQNETNLVVTYDSSVIASESRTKQVPKTTDYHVISVWQKKGGEENFSHKRWHFPHHSSSSSSSSSSSDASINDWFLVSQSSSIIET